MSTSWMGESYQPMWTMVSSLLKPRILALQASLWLAHAESLWLFVSTLLLLLGGTLWRRCYCFCFGFLLHCSHLGQLWIPVLAQDGADLFGLIWASSSILMVITKKKVTTFLTSMMTTPPTIFNTNL
ncbi:hypothetical protein U1Q18_030861 [Sarracenia purpurea var. burkii]